MKKKIIIPVVSVAVLALAGAVAFRGMNRPPDNRIRLSGNIELTEVNIAFKTAGRLLERTVDEGDRVTKGQIIARLDRDQLLRQRDREQAAAASAVSQLAQAETAAEWQKQTLDADLAQRRADIASAEARLSELQNGARPEEIQDAKGGVENAQAE